MIEEVEVVVKELTEIVANKGTNIIKLCRECEECLREKECRCGCENCKEVRNTEI